MNEKEVYMSYKRNNKWLGIIDYKSLSILVIYLIVTWNIIDFFNIKLEYKVYIFVFLSVPAFVLLCININSESAIDVLIILIKYLFKNKIYISTNYLKVENIKKTNKIFFNYNKKT